MTYIRANKEEIDAWERLGNKGWTWKSLLPYYRKAERYFIPTPDQFSIGATYEPKYHNFKGPLHVGYSRDLVKSDSGPRIIKAWDSLGVPLNPDFNSGDIRGVAIGPQTLDPPSDMRWDAARAYVYPVEKRKNLKVLKGTVRKLLWSKKPQKGPKSHGKLQAEGVEYFAPDGRPKSLYATKEVIVSAGGLRTPGILEASGIGNPRFVQLSELLLAEFPAYVSFI
jgi:choline dehydrogenase-like flavoprotein